MAVSGFFKYAQRALFSKPTPERQLTKLAKQHHFRRVVELGIGSVDTTAKLLVQIAKQAGETPVAYTGFDAFDERPADGPGLSLIAAHRELIGCGARVRLQPGGPTSGVPAMANTLQDTDLVLLSSTACDRLMQPVWYYLPRMCHPGTLVLRRQPGVEEGDQGEWSPVSLEEVGRLAGVSTVRHAA